MRGKQTKSSEIQERERPASPQPLKVAGNPFRVAAAGRLRVSSYRFLNLQPNESLRDLFDAREPIEMLAAWNCPAAEKEPLSSARDLRRTALSLPPLSSEEIPAAVFLGLRSVTVAHSLLSWPTCMTLADPFPWPCPLPLTAPAFAQFCSTPCTGAKVAREVERWILCCS